MPTPAGGTSVTGDLPPADGASPGNDLHGLSPGEARRRALREEARKPAVRVAEARAAAGLQELELAAAKRPDDDQVQLELAKRLHLEGVDGDDKAAERAERMLAELAKEPGAPAIALAYYGSARTLAAKRSWAFWRKGELAEEGLRLMDDAVAAAPGDLEVRFIRAISCYALPFFFDRGDQAASDFARVARSASRAVRAGELDAAIGVAALFYEGVVRADRGDVASAKVSWEEAVALGPLTPHGQAARARLGRTR
ncbi:MAG: hypothetical protein D6776_03215 [Planctomycetota bacterium]|nr:MAG: hypothetical protein D6776_03215 [Planctomycetota bacterium]